MPAVSAVRFTVTSDPEISGLRLRVLTDHVELNGVCRSLPPCRRSPLEIKAEYGSPCIVRADEKVNSPGVDSLPVATCSDCPAVTPLTFSFHRPASTMIYAARKSASSLSTNPSVSREEVGGLRRMCTELSRLRRRGVWRGGLRKIVIPIVKVGSLCSPIRGCFRSLPVPEGSCSRPLRCCPPR